MDVNNTPQQGPARAPHPGMPHRPQPSMGRHPMVDGFTVRRPMQPGATPGAPAHRPAQPQLQSLAPQPHHSPTPSRPIAVTQHVQPTPSHPQSPKPQIHVSSPSPVAATSSAPVGVQQPRPTQPKPFQQTTPTPPTHPVFGGATRTVTPTPAATPALESIAPTPDEQPVSASRPPRDKNQTGHAGWAGFVIFIILTALLISPFIPGKILQDFPFASNTFSTGDSTLDCLGKQGQLNTTTKYNTKDGSPITYRYSTSATETATCDGQSQSAVTGHTSQFNPLGLVIDVLLSLAIAIGASYVWRLIFGEKRHRPRGTHEEI